MALEQEIKLSVLEDEIDFKSVGILGYQQSEVTSRRLISTYFDTPELALINSGFGLRLRFDGEQWFQTVKENGQVTNGLHQRQEWEEKIPGKAFDEDFLKATPLQALLVNTSLWSTVSPVFTTDFIRQTMMIKSQKGDEVEVAYDKGHIYTDDKTSPIHEIELELKLGDIEELHSIASYLKSIMSLKLTESSKAQIGYSLLSTHE
jgi:inorganic triphosphatase YgiF